jgi:hypothetical protein
MVQRSCRPRHNPTRVPQRTERRIIGLRVSRRLGPARITWAARVKSLECAPGPDPLRLPESGLPGLRVPRSRSPSASMSENGPASWSTSMSRSSATSPAGGWRTGGRAQGNRSKPTTTTARKGGHPSPVLRPRPPVYRPRRPLPASARKPPPRSCAASAPGTPPSASPSRASCLTTATATDAATGQGLRLT